MLLELVFGHLEIVEKLLVFSLILVQRLRVVLQRVKNADLNELLQRENVLRLPFQLNIRFLIDYEVVLGELLFVGLEFLLEDGTVATSVLVFDVTNLVGVLGFKLVLLVSEVLPLGLDDYTELGFFTLCLLNQLFELGDFLEVLDFLRRDLLIQHVLSFLQADTVFKIRVAAISSKKALVAFSEERSQIWVDA